jgi:oxygen-dependent protoporphyrinogen oxidase
MTAQPTAFDADVAVIGAGITGLTTAHHLARQGFSVVVAEAEPRPGGAIGTTRAGGFLVEHGPNSLLDTNPSLHQLFAALGLTERRVYASDQARNRYIVRDGRLHALPMSPPALLRSQLLSRRGKLRLLAEPLVRRAPADAEETLAEFVERRLGREFLDYAIDAFVAGVYAGVPHRLSVRDAFPKLHRLEERYGGVFKGAILGRRERQRSGQQAKQSARMFSFREGLQTLVDALAAERGPGLRLGQRLTRLAPHGSGYSLEFATATGRQELRARVVLMAIPAHAYPQVQSGLDLEEARQALAQIEAPPVSMVFLGYRQQPAGHALDGFGFLIPTCEHRRILGTLFSSSLFPDRAPAGGAALTTFVGGMRQPELAGLSDEDLLALVRHDLADLLQITAPPDEVVIRRWQRAIPQYQVGHRALIAALERTETRHPGLFLHGNFRGGISVGDCIEQSGHIATRLGAYLRPT